MRFVQVQAPFYAGVDLHARTLYLCVLDPQGNVKLSRNLTAQPRPFLDALAPFPGAAVGCECMHCWYWLADTCRDHHIPFYLGHALAMKAVHGCKTKNDARDAHTIAQLLRGGNFPPAYAYPRERRSLRDLLRTRLRFVRLRARTYGHLHTARRQLNLTPAGSDVKYKSKRDALLGDVPDAHMKRSMRADLDLLGPLDDLIRHLERDLEVAADEHFARELAVLQSIPGVGLIISLTVLLEIDRIERFDSRQQFCSYARLMTPKQESGGKAVGVGGRKEGNAWLKWAFSEAAVLSAQKDARIGVYLTKLQTKHGKARGISVLAHKLGRAMYHMLKHKAVFDRDRFLRG